jgi:hypothetical protein
VKWIVGLSFESFPPVVLSSTSAMNLMFLETWKSFFTGLPFLQLSYNRAIADQALSADACLAIELSLPAQGNQGAKTTQ